MNLDFAGLLDDFLYRSNSPHVKNDRISPSEVSCGCARKVVFSRDPVRIKTSEYPYPASIANFFLGNAIHGHFQREVFKRLKGITVEETEYRLESEYIKGSVDMIISYEEPKTGERQKAVLEFKTADNDKFQWMKENGPKPEHREQITLYMGETGIHEGYIIVVNKKFFEKRTPVCKALEGIAVPQESPFLQFKIDCSEQLYRSLKDRCLDYMRQIKEYKEDGIVPNKPAGAWPYGMPCFWCSFRTQCWGQEAYEEKNLSQMTSSASKDVQKAFTDYQKAVSALQNDADKLESCEKQFKKLMYKHRSPHISGANYSADYMSGVIEIKTKDAHNVCEQQRDSHIRQVEEGTVPFVSSAAKEIRPADLAPKSDSKRIGKIPSTFEEYWQEIEQQMAQS